MSQPVNYSQTRIKYEYAVRHCSSGQLLGYALLSEKVLDDSLVKLAPWVGEDGVIPDTETQTQLNICISENSAVTENVESAKYVHTKADCLQISPASASGTTDDVSLRHQYLAGSSSSSQILNSSRNALLLPVAMSDTINATPAVPGSEETNKCENESEVCKRTRNNNYEPPPYSEGKYKMFCVDIEPGVNSFYRKKVRCILCGTEMLGKSFKNHLISQHEGSVSCEFCNKMFNGRQIQQHKKKWHKSELSIENNIGKASEYVERHLKGLPSVDAIIGGDVERHMITKEIEGNENGCSKSSSPCQAKIRSPNVVLKLSSATERGLSCRIKIDENAKIRKAMRKFGSKFNVDYRSLQFFQDNQVLDGEETVMSLNGTEIVVYGQLQK